jgi:GTP pyrophosphokinase
MQLDVLDLSLEQVNGKQLKLLLKEFNLESVEDLLAEIGLGNRMSLLVARRLAGDDEPTKKAGSDSDSSAPLVIKGTEGMVVKFAKCCRPIPGDGIVAVFSTGRGIVVHRHECHNLGDFQKQGEHWLDVRWEDELSREFSAELQVEVGSKLGVLATVAATIAGAESDIEHVTMEDRDGRTSILKFVVSVKDRKHLARVIKNLRTLPAVLHISRHVG